MSNAIQDADSKHFNIAWCEVHAFSFFVAWLFIALCIVVPPLEAQQCYIQTNEYALGNWFVRATSDSTCFGQWYDTLRFQNYKTQEVYYEFNSRDHFGYNTGFFTARVSDIIGYDSILIVNWEDGAVFRFLKVCFNRDIVELPSPLDEMPLLKYELEQHSFNTRKIRKVNDSILLLSSQRMVYSFIIANGAIRCVDSLLKYSPDRGCDIFDSRNDTLVIIAVPEMHASLYSIASDGRFAQMSVVKIPRELDYSPMYYGLENIYIQGLRLAALIRSDEGFLYVEGQQVYGAPHPPLFLQESIALIDIAALDRIDIYSQQLESICSKPEATSRTVLSVSNYGDKIFIA